MGWLKDAVASVKSETKKAGQNISSTTKAAEATIAANAKKAGAALKNVASKVLTTAEDIPFAILLPFKGIMAGKLDSNHISHTSALHDIAIKFAAHVSGLKHFDANYFEGNSGTLYNVDTNELVGAGGSILSGAATGGATGAIAATIQAVVNYFKNLQAKKASGQPLTPEETKELAQGEQIASSVNATLTGVVEASITTRVKDFMFSWKGGVVLIVIVALVGYAVYSSGKKK